MAYGTNNSFGEQLNPLSFTLKDKDLPAPIFKITKKEGDKYVDAGEAPRVDGDVISVRLKKGEYQGKEIVSTTVALKDSNAKEIYFVSVPFTYLGRSIMNSLANLSSYNGVEISVWKSKPKDGKPAFSNGSVRQNGERIYGLIENDKLPAIPKIKVGKDLHADPSEINAFFEVMMTELDAKIKAARGSGATKVDEPATAQEAVNVGADDESVPF